MNKNIERVRRSRAYRNKAEQAFVETARAKGWTVTKQGYPDFICYTPDGGMVLVEVKPRRSCKLKKSQWLFMNVAAGYGLKCYKWSPDHDWAGKVLL